MFSYLDSSIRNRKKQELALNLLHLVAFCGIIVRVINNSSIAHCKKGLEVRESIEKSKRVLEQVSTLLQTQKQQELEILKRYEKLLQVEKEILNCMGCIDELGRASLIVGYVVDKNTQDTLSYITGIINQALPILFPRERHIVSIEPSMYRGTYPHYTVCLTSDGVLRSFDLSGSGLSQIVSFLFAVCLVEIRGGRKFICVDEVFNGLHPDAKELISGIVETLSKEYQFIIVEYGVDLSKQYEIRKEHSVSSLGAIEGYNYYEEVEKQKKKKES